MLHRLRAFWISKNIKISTLDWFQSYVDFGLWMVFSYWWSCIRKKQFVSLSEQPGQVNIVKDTRQRWRWIVVWVSGLSQPAGLVTGSAASWRQGAGGSGQEVAGRRQEAGGRGRDGEGSTTNWQLGVKQVRSVYREASFPNALVWWSVFCSVVTVV